MAAPISPSMGPIHQPASPHPGRSRKLSMRKSFVSTPLPPGLESPRMPLPPQDTETFRYDPAFLPRWTPDHALWIRLPDELRSALTKLQRAGAAVLTDYERLESLSGEIGFGSDSPEDEMMLQLEDSVSSFSSFDRVSRPPLRSDSSASSSATFSVRSSRSPSPPTSLSQTTSSLSPSCLTPSEISCPPVLARGLPRERSFSTPQDPQNAKYVAELSHIRTISIPRLRHAARQVDGVLTTIRTDGGLESDDLNDFENWWAEKHYAITSLEDKTKRLCAAANVPSSGVGWTAP
ncbi:uncharacterized protein EI97DRAFT_307874 [Westerdykella ornata]|uniref:Uncharacterized protein n=1 Tax=Westerdykella ornata TaxID=318751 RepID=A0A6A6JLR6_WESOR|nr:uncharacterized protein EI97DRAFT_307874 [Westerdykella ornata]KAF2277053.1 hypothetical protein EI97DRAFT_307874 [Westerdykella ornata]